MGGCSCQKRRCYQAISRVQPSRCDSLTCRQFSIVGEAIFLGKSIAARMHHVRSHAYLDPPASAPNPNRCGGATTQYSIRCVGQIFVFADDGPALVAWVRAAHSQTYSRRCWHTTRFTILTGLRFVGWRVLRHPCDFFAAAQSLGFEADDMSYPG